MKKAEQQLSNQQQPQSSAKHRHIGSNYKQQQKRTEPH
jgi:hypothetical protein